VATNSKSLRVAGTLFLAVNGTSIPAKGNFSVGFGSEKKTAVIGVSGIHGFKGETQVPFIEGTITNRSGLDVKALLAIEDATITLQFQGGKTLVLRQAWHAGDGTLNADEGEIAVRFEGLSLEEI
jgi:hypothetical protein